MHHQQVFVVTGGHINLFEGIFSPNVENLICKIGPYIHIALWSATVVIKRVVGRADCS